MNRSHQSRLLDFEDKAFETVPNYLYFAKHGYKSPPPDDLHLPDDDDFGVLGKGSERRMKQIIAESVATLQKHLLDVLHPDQVGGRHPGSWSRRRTSILAPNPRPPLRNPVHHQKDPVPIDVLIEATNK